MSIEQDLHRAFKRKPAPADLAERVLARLDASGHRRRPGIAEGTPRRSGRPEGTPPRRSGRPGSIRWLAAAAAITLSVSGGVRYYTYQQTLAEAERVKQDIRIALQITSQTLALAQARIAQSVDNSR